MVFEDVLCEEGPPGGSQHTPRAWARSSRRARHGLLRLDRVLAIAFPVALGVLALLAVHGQGMGVVDDQGCLWASACELVMLLVGRAAGSEALEAAKEDTLRDASKRL